jgi:predicted nucleic acid-binding protein
MTVLLDTNLIIDALNDRKGRREFLQHLIDDGHQLACCAVAIAEIYAGMKRHEAKLTDQFLERLAFYGATRATARMAGEMKATWMRRGHALALTDLMIAAVAVECGLTLATDNRKHFPMPDLKLLTLPAVH